MRKALDKITHSVIYKSQQAIEKKCGGQYGRVGADFRLHPLIHIFTFWGLGAKCWDKLSRQNYVYLAKKKHLVDFGRSCPPPDMFDLIASGPLGGCRRNMVGEIV